MMRNCVRIAKSQLLGGLVAILAVFALVLVPAAEDNAFAAEPGASEGAAWVQDSRGWWYQYADGGWPASCWEMIGGEWYLFDSAGYMKTGWIFASDGWRHLGSDGAMDTGWVYCEGAWYYLDPANDGIMATGWLSLDGDWRYLGDDGAMDTGWVFYAGGWYYLDPANDGIMATGWIWDGAWYYLDPANDGRMATGWVCADGEWYYLLSSGKMVSSCWIGDYYLLSSGVMAKSQWVGQWYVGSDGEWVPNAVDAADGLVAAMNAGEPATLLNDISLGGSMAVEAEVDIDLNGHTLNVACLELKKGGHIENGRIESGVDTGRDYQLSVTGGTLTMDDVAVNVWGWVSKDVNMYGFFYVFVGLRVQDATAILNDCSVTSGGYRWELNNSESYFIAYGIDMFNAKVVMNGGSVVSDTSNRVSGGSAFQSGGSSAVTFSNASYSSPHFATIAGNLVVNTTDVNITGANMDCGNAGGTYELNYIS